MHVTLVNMWGVPQIVKFKTNKNDVITLWLLQEKM